MYRKSCKLCGAGLPGSVTIRCRMSACVIGIILFGILLPVLDYSFVISDGAGMLGRILFAWFQG